MTRLLWDRLMETCVRRGGTDILLVPGSPPFLRVENGLRAFEVEPLTELEVSELLLALKPPHQIINNGYLDFDLPYGDHWFRVAAFGTPAPKMIILMRFPRSAVSGASSATIPPVALD